MRQSTDPRLARIPGISRVKAYALASLAPDKIHAAELIFSQFVRNLHPDERAHVLAMLKAGIFDAELSSDKQAETRD